jgi:hypothetical protein
LNPSTTISDLTATTQPFGFYIYRSDDNSFINADISNLTGDFPPIGTELMFSNNNDFSSLNISNLEGKSQAIGIFLYRSASDNSFESIGISDVTATNTDAYGLGIAISGGGNNTRNKFHAITIPDITGGSATGGALGIYLADSGTKDNSFSEYDISVLDGAKTDGITINRGASSNSFSVDSITGAQNGFHVSGDAVNGDASDNSIHFTKIFSNTEHGVKNENESAIVDATNNWWGCNAGSGGTGCDSASQNVNYDPWLVLKITPEKQIVELNEKIQIDANLIYNFDGENTLSDGYVPNGIPAEFSVQPTGVVNPVSTETFQGQVSTTFTPTKGGVFNVCVTVDNKTVCTEDVVVPAAAAVDDVYKMMFNSTLDVGVDEGVTINDTGITEGFG